MNAEAVTAKVVRVSTEAQPTSPPRMSPPVSVATAMVKAAPPVSAEPRTVAGGPDGLDGGSVGTHHPERRSDGDSGDRKVDPEDRRPAEVLSEHPAEQRPRSCRGPVGRAPHAEGRTPVPDLVGSEQQGGSGGKHSGAADALHHAGRDQHFRVGGEAARQRGQAEDAQTADVGTPVAEAVREGTRGQQQGGEHQGIAVDHPLQRGEGSAEVGSHARQCDIHDRHIHQQDDGAQADRRQGPPFAHVGFSFALSRCRGTGSPPVVGRGQLRRAEQAGR